MREGWKCPVCARGVAPNVMSCDHGGDFTGIGAPINPSPIWPNSPSILPYRPHLSTTCGGSVTVNISRPSPTFDGADLVKTITDALHGCSTYIDSTTYVS